MSHFINALSKSIALGVSADAPTKKVTAVSYEMSGHTYYYTGSVWAVLFGTDNGNFAAFLTKENAEEFINTLSNQTTFVPKQLPKDVTVNFYTYSIPHPMGAATVVEENVNAATYMRVNANNLEEVAISPDMFPEGHNPVKYNTKTNVFLASRIGGSALCSISGEIITVSPILMSMYGAPEAYVDARKQESLKLTFVTNLNYTVSAYDPSFTLQTLADGSVFTNEYIRENAAKFFTSPVSGTLSYVETAVTLHSGVRISSEDFRKFGFTCSISKEKHLLSENPRSGHRGIADAHYVPQFREVLRDYKTDPMNVFGHVGMDNVVREGFMPDKKDGKKNRDLYMAMEIEVYAESEAKGAKAIVEVEEARIGICCSDGSLPANGFEIKTLPQFHMTSSDRLDELQKIFVSNNIMANHKCGVHIHVSRSALTELQVDRIMKFIYSFGNRVLVEAVAGRKANDTATQEFAKYHLSKSSLSSNQVIKKNPKGGNVLIKKSVNKYCAVNANKDYTIEFRMFQGTVDTSRLKMNAEFVAALVEFTSPGVYDLPHTDTPSYRDFLRFLLDPKARRRKDYPNLIEFLVSKQIIDQLKKGNSTTCA